jgi:hypothetical protein
VSHVNIKQVPALIARTIQGFFKAQIDPIKMVRPGGQALGQSDRQIGV